MTHKKLKKTPRKSFHSDAPITSLEYARAMYAATAPIGPIPKKCDSCGGPPKGPTCQYCGTDQ